MFELVKLHAGTIQVESKLGEGTTLKVLLPLGHAHLPSNQIKTTTSLQISLDENHYARSVSWWLPSIQLMPLPADQSMIQLSVESTTKITQPSTRVSDHDSIVTNSKERRVYRIVLADDNYDMREYVTRLLSHKYEVISVSHGNHCSRKGANGHLTLVRLLFCNQKGLEALQAVKQYAPVDLVLTDVMMPHMDGFTLLKELR